MAYSDEALPLNLNQDPDAAVQEIIAGTEALYSSSPVEHASAEVASLFDAPEVKPVQPLKPDFSTLAEASPAVINLFVTEQVGEHLAQIRQNDADMKAGSTHAPATVPIQFPVLGAHNHQGYKHAA